MIALSPADGKSEPVPENVSDIGVSVTLCIPSYNRAAFVAETLRSVLSQTRTDWEAIVVEDGSTDESRSIIENFAAHDARIRLLIRDDLPKGAATCRNIAVTAARGRYVLFLDTDDVMAPYCLSQRVKVMDSSPALDYAVFPMLMFDKSVHEARRLWNIDSAEDDLSRILRMDPVGNGTALIWKSSSFRALGMWNPELAMWQDVELHLRAFALGLHYSKHFDLPPDVYLRETEDSMSRGSYNSYDKRMSRKTVARKAVEILEQIRPNQVSDARFFCASTIFSDAAVRDFRAANEMRLWAASKGVFSRWENAMLQLALAGMLARVDRIRPFRTVRGAIQSHFQPVSNVGRHEASAQR